MTADIDQLIEQLPVAQAREVKRAYRKQAKDETAAFLWCFFLGGVGAHRFYLRQWTRALLHLQVLLIAALVVVAGIIANLPPLIIAAIVAPFILGALIWTFIDLTHIDDEVSERNLLLAERLVAGALLADPDRERQAEAQLTAAERQQRAPAATDAASLSSPDDQFTPAPESPAPLDVGVQAMTGIAGLGIAGGYRVIAEPSHDAAQATPAVAPDVTSTTDPTVAPSVAPATAPYAPSVAAPAWDTPTPPPSTFSSAPALTPVSPARDLTDLGGDLGSIPPIADIEPHGPWLLAPDAAAETGPEEVGLLILEPEPEAAPAPPLWPAAPDWSLPAQPPEWPLPSPASDAQPPATEAVAAPPAAPAETGAITQDMLADAAGLAGAMGSGAMGSGAMGSGAMGSGAMGILADDRPSDAAQTAPAAPQHLLRHIRVVRQVKIGDTVEETVAEAYIDPTEDPEPVRERLREQLRRDAEG